MGWVQLQVEAARMAEREADDTTVLVAAEYGLVVPVPADGMPAVLVVVDVARVRIGVHADRVHHMGGDGLKPGGERCVFDLRPPVDVLALASWLYEPGSGIANGRGVREFAEIQHRVVEVLAFVFVDRLACIVAIAPPIRIDQHFLPLQRVKFWHEVEILLGSVRLLPDRWRNDGELG